MSGAVRAVAGLTSSFGWGGSVPDVGIKLIVEILDHHQDVKDSDGRTVGLTVGELRDLLVLAENANDKTRETFGPVHEVWIIRRANKTSRTWKNAINALMRKRVLEYARRGDREMRGHTGQYAVYRIPGLCPDPPHDGRQGCCTFPGDWVTSQVTQSREEGHPAGDPSTGVGHLADASGSPAGCEWVTQQMTPSPLSPQTPLLSLADAVAERALRAVGLEDEREIKDCIDWITEDCRPRTPAWWRTVAENGDLPAHIDRWRAQRASAAPSLPAWCGKCGDDNPAARTNPRWRVLDGQPCPTCHPDAIGRPA
ncbi:hypothetical protein [Parafrankia discariae]|uniref:hypothetical protein n=1 Tax=Parafrankia discariae TaxID=365528 RepID=UPI0012B69390|nr:hypothetical protein [Parafrankia discariae]